MIIKKRKQAVRNGKIYISAWIDKEIAEQAKDQAKEDGRTLAAHLERALAFHRATTLKK